MERICRLKWFGCRFSHWFKLEEQRWIWSVSVECCLFICDSFWLRIGCADLGGTGVFWSGWSCCEMVMSSILLFCFSDLFGCCWSACDLVIFFFFHLFLFRWNIVASWRLNWSVEIYHFFCFVFDFPDNVNLASWLNATDGLLFMSTMPVCLFVFLIIAFVILISIYEIMM